MKLLPALTFLCFSFLNATAENATGIKRKRAESITPFNSPSKRQAGRSLSGELKATVRLKSPSDLVDLIESNMPESRPFIDDLFYLAFQEDKTDIMLALCSRYKVNTRIGNDVCIWNAIIQQRYLLVASFLKDPNVSSNVRITFEIFTLLVRRLVKLLGGKNNKTEGLICLLKQLLTLPGVYAKSYNALDTLIPEEEIRDKVMKLLEYDPPDPDRTDANYFWKHLALYFKDDYSSMIDLFDNVLKERFYDQLIYFLSASQVADMRESYFEPLLRRNILEPKQRLYLSQLLIEQFLSPLTENGEEGFWLNCLFDNYSMLVGHNPSYVSGSVHIGPGVKIRNLSDC